MSKKIVIIMVVLILIISSVSFAENVNEQEEAAKNLVALGLLKGYEDGSLGLENNITRAEFATLVVRLICKEEEAKSNTDDTIFTDVKKDHWASGYINIAVNEGLINGYPDGTFKPQNNISYGEALTLIVRMLGYEDEVNKDLEWPLNYIAKATQLGVNNSSVLAPNNKATRGDIAVFVNKSLLVKLNNEIAY